MVSAPHLKKQQKSCIGPFDVENPKWHQNCFVTPKMHDEHSVPPENCSENQVRTGLELEAREKKVYNFLWLRTRK